MGIGEHDGYGPRRPAEGRNGAPGNRLHLILPVLLTLLATPAAAQDPSGDVPAGRTLARELCSSCHLVAPEQRGPVPDGVPSFMAIAARPDLTGERLIEAMRFPPHPEMPLPPLDQRQRGDVAAYIMSLGVR